MLRCQEDLNTVIILVIYALLPRDSSYVTNELDAHIAPVKFLPTNFFSYGLNELLSKKNLHVKH